MWVMMATRSSTRVKIPSINELPLSEDVLRFFSMDKVVLKPARPVAVRGSWSREEDDLLLSAVKGMAVDEIVWETVALEVGSHTAKQCRERYLVKLNPEVRRTPFEQWEDEIIQSERLRIGNHWSLIAQLLPGRTSCSVKNRWYTVLRYRQMVPNVVLGYPPERPIPVQRKFTPYRPTGQSMF